MANITFKRGQNLGNLPIVDGQFIVNTKERCIYTDIGTERVRLGDFQEFATLAELQANSNPRTTALYYVSELNCLAKWNGDEYVQINKDTGVTSVEVVGTGNAVTASSYDPVTRKLTLTKGETFATREYVGEIPTGENYAGITNVVGYINKKAEETLAAAQGGSSETAASVKLALDNYIETTNPRLDALEAVDHSHENAEVLNGITAEKVAAWDASEGNAKTYAEQQAAGVQSKLNEEILRAKAAEEANATAAGNAQTAADNAQNAVDVLSAKVGTVAENKTVVEMISDAQTAATYDDEEVRGLISANADAIAAETQRATGIEGGLETRLAAVEGDYLRAADKEALQTQINTIMNNPDAEGIINSINEFTNYVTEHGTIAEGFRVDIDKNKADIEANTKAIADQATSDAATYETKEDAADKLTEAKEYADGKNTAMDTRVKAIENDYLTSEDHAAIEKLISDETARADAAEKANAASIKAISDDYLKASDKEELSDLVVAEADRAKAAEAKALEDAKAYADGLAGNYDESGAAATAEANAKAYADGLAGNYDASGSAAAAEAAAKAYADSLILTWGEF